MKLFFVYTVLRNPEKTLTHIAQSTFMWKLIVLEKIWLKIKTQAYSMVRREHSDTDGMEAIFFFSTSLCSSIREHDTVIY